MRYSLNKTSKLFSLENQRVWNPEELKTAQEQKQLPGFLTHKGKRAQTWSSEQIAEIGEQIGFLSKPDKPQVISVFVTKGGVLKSTLTLNIARMAALHNIKTCVLGLDMQGDITAALGFDHGLTQDLSLEEALEKINSIQGLPDYFYGNIDLEDLLQPTDLPTLQFIPETPELVSFEQNIMHRNRREYWLKDNVIEPLKEKFDLILIDCSPNWNQLITNALVSCDLLISPLECKINNFRNFKMFETFIAEFKKDLDLNFNQIFIPTRLNQNRKLSREINEWYNMNLPQCMSYSVRESTQGEESSAMHICLPEYAPSSSAATEMKALMQEVWSKGLNTTQKNRTSKQLGVSHGLITE